MAKLIIQDVTYLTGSQSQGLAIVPYVNFPQNNAEAYIAADTGELDEQLVSCARGESQSTVASLKTGDSGCVETKVEFQFPLYIKSINNPPLAHENTEYAEKQT